MLLDKVVKVAVVVGHYDVEVLLALLVGDVRPYNFHHEIAAQHVHHLDLPILVLLILHDPLNSHNLACLLQPPLEHLTERALPNHSDDIHFVHEQARGSRIETAFGFQIELLGSTKLFLDFAVGYFFYWGFKFVSNFVLLLLFDFCENAFLLACFLV